MSKDLKTIHLQYFAILREERGLNLETIKTKSRTALELYRELSRKFNFKLSSELLRVAINGEFKDWKTPLKANDTVVFIPPVAGG